MTRQGSSDSAPAAGAQDAARFVVEIAVRGGYPDVSAVSESAREAAAMIRRDGTPVRYVRTVYVPEDGACMLIFEALTAEAAQAAATMAGLSVTRVSPALRVQGS